MTETVRISFEGPLEPGATLAVVYNARVLPAALFSQVTRFGLKSPPHQNSLLSGRLKGTREAFVGMVQSYGVMVEIVPAALLP